MKANQATEVKGATPPRVAPQARQGRNTLLTEPSDESAAPATAHRSPRCAELVERVDTGRFYLRTYADGHYLWQPVVGRVAAVPDTGIWLRSEEFQHTYWYNHGTYRRRAGCYYPVPGFSFAKHAA